MGASTKEKERDKDKDSSAKGAGRRRPGRIPTSCAECRRLKLRCDKKVPCEKCVSRGCGAICPDGSLTAGKGNRLVLANTEQLHDRIEHLCARISELESALRGAQAQLSEEEHPLLRSDLLQLKSPQQNIVQPRPMVYPADGDVLGGDQIASGSVPGPSRKAEDENLIDAFGTLSIRENGETQFLGQTARSEFLIRALSRPSKPANEHTAPTFGRLSQNIMHSAHHCTDVENEADPYISHSHRNRTSDSRDHFASTARDLELDAFPSSVDLHQEVVSSLPPLSEAIQLCEIYLDYGRWMYTPLPRSELFDEVLGIVYRSESYPPSHALGLLCIIFAIGALFDPARPSCSLQAQEFYYLAKATLGTSPAWRDTTVWGIQCQVHIAQYLELSDWEAMGSTAGWSYVGHAVRMGTQIGLHLNSARWNLPEDMQQRRRRVFWQLFTSDTWSSFHYGRPPSLSRAFIDCPLPKDPEELINADGQREMGFHAWTYRFSLFSHRIIESAFGSARPPYSIIIDFDKQIRDFPTPVNLVPDCGPGGFAKKELYMQRLIVMSYKENLLMHLHRAYFAQALQDQEIPASSGSPAMSSPDDPSASISPATPVTSSNPPLTHKPFAPASGLTTHKFAPSVIATYRSAWRLMKCLQVAWRNVPGMIARYGLMWSHCLSAGIVMCILVTRAPTSKMTKPSLEELDVMANLFEEAAPESRYAANIMETMQNLRRKAHEAADTVDAVAEPMPPPPPPFSGCELSLSTSELDRLGGRTQLISYCKDKSGPGSGSRGRPTSMNGSVTDNNEPVATRSSSRTADSGYGSCSSPESSSAYLTPDTLPSIPSPLPLPQTLSWKPYRPKPQVTTDLSSSPNHPPESDSQSIAPQNLHPIIAQDIRNIEMDLGMDLNGIEFHFFDPKDIPSSPVPRARGGTGGDDVSDQLPSHPRSMIVERNGVVNGNVGDAPDMHVSPTSASEGMNFGDFGDMDFAMNNMDMSVSGIFGNVATVPSSSSGAFSPLGHPQGSNAPNSQVSMLMPFGAPVLDATWQSFVEQLGF